MKCKDDWGLNHIGHIYVINLTRDERRKRSITENLNHIGVSDFDLIEAVDGSKLPNEVVNKIRTPLIWSGKDLLKQHQGEAGVWLSHKKCIEDAIYHTQHYSEKLNHLEKLINISQDRHEKQSLHNERTLILTKLNHYKTIIIFEDDTGFGKVNHYRTDEIFNAGILTHLVGKLTKFNRKKPFPTVTHKVIGSSPRITNEGQIFKKAWSELPDNWDMLYLNSYNHLAPISYSKHLLRLRWGAWLNAYIVSSKMYQPLLKVLNKIDEPNSILNAIDDEIASLHSNYQCFVVNPPVVYQERTGSIGGQQKLTKGQYEQMICQDKLGFERN